MSEESLAELSLPELIEELQSIPEPAAISYLPQTEGWIWLGVSAAIVLALVARVVASRRRASAYRRAALRELASVKKSPAAVATLLRRTALAAYPRRDVAGKSGEEWLQFLDETSEGDLFQSEVGRALAAAPYSTQAIADPEALAKLARRWIVGHRAQAPR